MHVAMMFSLVPNVLQVVIVPNYSNNDQTLERLFIVGTMNQTVSALHE